MRTSAARAFAAAKARTKAFAATLEQKVIAQVSAGSVAAAAAWLAGRYIYHGQVPDSARTAIDAFAPVAAGAIAGWLAKHTPRPVDPVKPVTALPQPQSPIGPAVPGD